MLTPAPTASVIAPPLISALAAAISAGRAVPPETMAPPTITMTPPRTQVTPAASLTNQRICCAVCKSSQTRQLSQTPWRRWTLIPAPRESRPTSLEPAPPGPPMLFAGPCRSAAVEGSYRKSYTTCLCKDPCRDLRRFHLRFEDKCSAHMFACYQR